MRGTIIELVHMSALFRQDRNTDRDNGSDSLGHTSEMQTGDGMAPG